MTLRTCPGCGMRHARGEDVEPCASCLLDGWAVGLGRAIRRFLRRAEVERLQSTIFDAFDHSPLCRTSVCVCSLAEWTEALSRLAALAMEVEP